MAEPLPRCGRSLLAVLRQSEVAGRGLGERSDAVGRTGEPDPRAARITDPGGRAELVLLRSRGDGWGDAGCDSLDPRPGHALGRNPWPAAGDKPRVCHRL